MPFFSVIIPTYNSANTLQKAIDSITLQTFGDYEIVFVDGASKDNTLKIIEDAKQYWPAKIKYISEPDKGIYDAMNKGIPLATGDWLYFMGSDDLLYSPDVLEKIHLEMQKEPVDLIYGNVTGESSKTHYVYNTTNLVLSQGIHHQSIFYKKSIFDIIDKYDPFFKIAADYHLTLKVFCNLNFKTRYVNIDIANYGESGLSSAVFDYTFYSYHYKFLAQHTALSNISEPDKCLDKSIYCCLQLAQRKINMGFGWKNILYYISANNSLGVSYKIKTLLRMLYWTLTPASSLSE